MDVTTTKMLSVAIVIVLVITQGYSGPISSDSKLIEKLVPKDTQQRHTIQRRYIVDADNDDEAIVALESRFGYHNYLPYPNSNRGPYPGQYTPPFGNNFHYLPGQQHDYHGSFSHHHHVINHDYPHNKFHHNHHHNFHHNQYPHNHHNCKHDSSSESESSSEETATKLPYPGKYTPPPLKPVKPITPSTTEKGAMEDSATENFDIDVRLGQAGK